MLRKFAVVAVSLAFLSANAVAQDAKTVIANAQKTLGDLKSITYSGTAKDVAFQQCGANKADMQCRGAHDPMRPIDNYVRVIDLTAPLSRATGVTNNIGAGGSTTVSQGAFNQQVSAQQADVSQAWNGSLEFYITPWGFLKGAAENNATASRGKADGKNYTVLTWNPKVKPFPSGPSYVIKGYVDDKNMVDRVETWLGDNIMGDMHILATYSGWKDFGGVMAPAKIVQTRGGWPFFEVNVTAARANPADLATLAQPAGGGGGGGRGGPGAPGAGAGAGRGGAGGPGGPGGAGAGRGGPGGPGAGAGAGRGGPGGAGAGRGGPGGPGGAAAGRGGPGGAGAGRGGPGGPGGGAPGGAIAQGGRGPAPAAGGARGGAPGGAPGGGGQMNVTSEKLGEGLYRLTTGANSYDSVIVEFKDYIMMLEAGQSQARAVAYIAETKKLIPNKPIRYVMNTHPHSDHTGGLPALVAEGATIITSKNNQEFFERALNTPRTLLDPATDVLARNPRKAKVEPVSEKKVYTDGTRTVEMYHTWPVPHSNGLMIAYIPKEKIIFQGDFSLPTGTEPVNDHVKALAPILKSLKLDFTRYINVHASANPQTGEEFWAAVAR
ncbi:MAG TPA: MBL fold metallo-hydrolase [Terriglobia bacterium]|nr:MBL fold metallo-hydrolase [Terriglobia bacterium]